MNIKNILLYSIIFLHSAYALASDRKSFNTANLKCQHCTLLQYDHEIKNGNCYYSWMSLNESGKSMPAVSCKTCLTISQNIFAAKLQEFSEDFKKEYFDEATNKWKEGTPFPRVFKLSKTGELSVLPQLSENAPSPKAKNCCKRLQNLLCRSSKKSA